MQGIVQGTAGQEPPVISGLTFERLLGQGGFADVFLYRQDLPSMLVAVKVLRRSGANLRDQLITEANTMAELAEHPYIASVLRAGVTDDDRAYLVMSYYPRPNLAERVRRQSLSVPEVLRTGVQLAAAVETAHRADILHRYIKPANVLVSGYGSPALADFGISGRGATVEDNDDVGVSVAWTAPEVLRGQSNGSVQADVYSLAATLSFLLAGRSPFEVPGGDNSHDAMLRRSLNESPARTGRADAPESLERLLRQSLDKDPQARPETALAMARSLVAIEQELRLPRTEIVLLDEAHHLAGGDADVTSIRAALGVDLLDGGAPTPAPEKHARSTFGWVVVGVAAVVLGSGIGLALAFSGDESTSNEAGDRPGTEVTETPVPGDTPSTGTPTEPDTTTDPASPSETENPAALDPCLVGTWESVRYREYHAAIGEITSLDRTVTIETDGRMTIRYDEALAGGGQGLTFDGEVEYLTSTSEGVQSFELIRNDATLAVSGIVTPLNPGVSDVEYTCSGDTFTQETATYSSTMERVDAGETT